jgi:hypothetical protein
MTFPTLKTGAVAQYPLEQTLRYSTDAVRFLDGSQQKFRLFGNGLRRWIVKLDFLDENELGAVTDFIDQQESAVFCFPDPISGSVVPKCIISGERFDATMTGEMQGQATVVIEEIP